MNAGAPQWLRESSYGMRDARRGPDRVEWVDPATQVGTVPFYQISGGGTVEADAAAIREVHDSGGRALSYVCFMDTVLDPTVTGAGKGRPLYTPELANALLVDDDLRFVNTRMDWSWRLNRHLLCYNSQAFVDAALQHVRAVLDLGVDGFFVDNAHSQHECSGHGHRIGYSERYGTVVARFQEPGSSTAFDPSLEEVPTHTHLDPAIDQTEAFHRFMLGFYALAKEYNPDNIVLLNNNTALPDASDGSMWESFICSWAWEGRRLSWAEVKAQGGGFDRLVEHGDVVVAVSYLGRTQTTVDDDAFFCYAAARLLGYTWCDQGWGGRGKVMGLRSANLGAPTAALVAPAENVAYRLYRRGVVVMNDTGSGQQVAVPLAGGLVGESFTDLYSGAAISPHEGSLQLSIPAHSGRVYTAR